MASGVKEMNGVVYRGTISGTTDNYGRLVTSLSGKDKIILDAYIQGQSHQVTPYRFVSGTTDTINFVVLQTNNTTYTRISNTAVTIDYFYIKK